MPLEAAGAFPAGMRPVPAPVARPLRVIVWGTYDTGKPRTRILLEGLRAQGVEITEIHADIWSDTADKSGLGPRAMAARLARLALAWPGLVARYLAAPDHDAVLVPYMGQFDVLALKPFAALRRRPVVWDMFLSLHDTVVDDRAMVGPRSAPARALHALEWLACRAAARVLMDTGAGAARVAESFGLAPGRVVACPVGAEPGAFPRAAPPKRGDGPLRILFYGQLIPLHGVGTILAAAMSPRGRAHRWRIIGSGQEEARVAAALAGADVDHVAWEKWVDYEALGQAIAESHICLGIFGTSGKAAAVVPNKVWQALMAGRPVVTRASPAMDEVFPAGLPGLARVPEGDPEALLDAIDDLRDAGLPVAPATALAAGDPREIGRRLVSVFDMLRKDRECRRT